MTGEASGQHLVDTYSNKWDPRVEIRIRGAEGS